DSARKPMLEWTALRAAPLAGDRLRYWFRPGGGARGIAVVLGEPSGGLACRDFDQEDRYELWARRFPDLAASLPTAKTHRGQAVYFRGPPGYSDLEDGEYRANEKHICFLPPSWHPKGGCYYRWLVPLPDGELPVISDPVAAGLLYQPLESCN